MRKGVALIACAVLVSVAAEPAFGADLRIAETINDTGDPGLTAAVWPNGDGTIEWRRCTDGGPVCEPLPESAYVRDVVGRGRVAFPGDSASGTVFEAATTQDGVETTVRTRVWRGRLTFVTPPVLQGEPAVGQPVTLVAGVWAGGWEPSPGMAVRGSILACRQPTGGECWLVSSSATFVPGPEWAGWYLIGSSGVDGGSATCQPILWCSVVAAPLDLPARLTNYTLRDYPYSKHSAPVGPIAAAPQVVGPPSAAPRVGRPPSASIRPRALRRNGRLSVGRVSCELRCTVRYKVSGGHRRAVVTKLDVTGLKALTIPPRRGKLTVRIDVDGKTLAKGVSRAR